MGSGVSVNISSLHSNQITCHADSPSSCFVFGQVLGHGGFALVRNAIHKTERRAYAVKEIILEKILDQNQSLDVVMSELNALQSAGDHPFIMKLYSAFREENCCYLVTDSLIGGDLRLHLRHSESFTENQLAYFAACLGSALNHLHQRNIIHRDVKPENIILNQFGTPFLSDFGIACIFSSEYVPICRLSSGTLPYLSPESLTYSHRHSFHADFWSLGITLYEVFYGKRPYEKHCPKSFIYFADNYYRLLWDRLNQSQSIPWNTFYSQISVAELHQNLNYPQHFIPLLPDGQVPLELTTPIPLDLQQKEELSPEGKSFISSLLDVRIEKRLGSPDLFSQYFAHPWLRKYGLTTFERILSLKPPFVPDTKQVQENISRKYDNTSLIQSFQQNKNSIILSPEMESQLAQYVYTAPKDQQMTKKNSTKSLTTEASISVGIHSESLGRLRGMNYH